MPKAGPSAALGFAIGAAVVLDRAGRAQLARRSRVLATTRGPIEVEITGSGPDVLVLHGSGGGFDQGTWLAHALGLAAHRVISVSRPGYLGTPDRETNDEAVGLLAATLDALGVERAAVVGASGGGMTARALATRHPERVRALVLLSAVSGPLASDGRGLALLLLGAGSDAVGALLAAARTRAGRRLLAELAPTVAAPERRVPGILRDRTISRSLPAPAGVAVPTLVVHGTADRVVPFAHAERAAAACANGELVAIDGGGHLCVLTHEAVGRRVRAFIAAPV